MMLFPVSCCFYLLSWVLDSFPVLGVLADLTYRVSLLTYRRS